MTGILKLGRFETTGTDVFFLDADFWQADRVIEFDNISVCGLFAPATSIKAE